MLPHEAVAVAAGARQRHTDLLPRVGAGWLGDGRERSQGAGEKGTVVVTSAADPGEALGRRYG